MKFDLILIVFAKADLDARSLNFVRASAQGNLSILYVSLKSDNPPLLPDNVHSIQIEIESKGSNLLRWHDFYKKTKSFLRGVKSDKIIYSDLYSLALSGFMRNKSLKAIYDSREIYSALGPISGKKFKQKLLAFFEKRWIKNIDEFIVSGELDADYLKKYFNTVKKFYIILNLPPYKEAYKQNLIRRRFNIHNDKAIFLYQGALVKNRGLYKFMDALNMLEGAVLVITGEGPDEDSLKAYANLNAQPGNVFFSGKIPYDKLHDWTCSADAGLALFEPVSLSYEYSLPNKLFELFMAGKPVLATNLPAMAAVFDKYPAGILVDRNLAPSDIAKAAVEILNPSNYKQLAAHALNAATEYNYSAQSKTINEILK